MFFELQEKYDQSIKPNDAYQIMKRNETIIHERIKALNGVTELHNPSSGKLYVYYYTDPKKGKIFFSFFFIILI